MAKLYTTMREAVEQATSTELIAELERRNYDFNQMMGVDDKVIRFQEVKRHLSWAQWNFIFMAVDTERPEMHKKRPEKYTKS